ncbi:Putative WRKY transcription factor [Arachis hypogaea]|nr:Putative WRKY transcription factor [Arachis hypogaea]
MAMAEAKAEAEAERGGLGFLPVTPLTCMRIHTLLLGHHQARLLRPMGDRHLLLLLLPLSDPAIVAPSRAGSCGKRQTTSNGTQDTQCQGTFAATGNSSTSAPKLRYDGIKCWHPPKPGLKRISHVFKKNYNKPWLSFDEADDDTRKIWWTEWRKFFDILDTEEDDIYQVWRFRAAICKKGARPYWIPPEVLGELMRRWDTNVYRQLQARNTAVRKLTRGTSLHIVGGTTFPEARLRLLTIVAPHSLSSLSPLTFSLSVSPLTLSLSPLTLSLQAETLSLSLLRVVASHSRLTCTTLHVDRRHSSSPSLALIVAVPPHHRRCAAFTIVAAPLSPSSSPCFSSSSSLNRNGVKNVKNEKKTRSREEVEEEEESSNNNYQPQSQTLSRRSDDGYNWRKYGQKQVKGSENPRSYYKCTFPNCPTKKKVERSLDGQITEIVYKGTHNHPKPQNTRRNSLSSSNSAAFAIAPSNQMNNSEVTDHQSYTHGSGQMDSIATPENSSISVGDDDFEQSSQRCKLGGDDYDDDEPDAKRWKIEGENERISGGGSRTVREARVVVQTTSDIDILDDGYRWRKYGQKVLWAIQIQDLKDVKYWSWHNEVVGVWVPGCSSMWYSYIESPFGTGNTANAALLSARPVFIKNLLQYMFNSVANVRFMSVVTALLDRAQNAAKHADGG